MSEQSKRMLRGGARAVTGVAIIGASLGAAALMGSGIIPLPDIQREPVSVTADTSQNAKFALVCTGAFAELGADAARPTEAISAGSSSPVITGTPSEQRDLQRESGEGTAPLVIEVAATDSLAAAEIQQVATPTIQGLSVSSCAEPLHEQWLVGGGTTLGQSSTVVLGNSSSVPSTVQLSVYDEHGKVDSARTTGVLVPAGAQRVVSLNGYAPVRQSLAVRVESTGAAVTAAMGVSQTVDIRSFAVDTVTRQLSPENKLVIPGVANSAAEGHAADGAAPDEDLYPVVVRVLSPEADGTATLRAMAADGVAQDLGTIKFSAGVVTDFAVKTWPANAQAVTIDSTAPIVGGVFGSADVPPAHDYAWFAPAPKLPADVRVPASVVLGGQLVLANDGDTEATVKIETEGGVEPEKTVKVPAGAAVPVDARSQLWLTSNAPISAGVRVTSGPNIAGYPVLPPIERSKSLTVYPR